MYSVLLIVGAEKRNNEIRHLTIIYFLCIDVVDVMSFKSKKKSVKGGERMIYIVGGSDQ